MKMTKADGFLIFAMGCCIFVMSMALISDPYGYWTQTFERIISLCLFGSVGITVMAVGLAKLVLKE